MLDDSGRRTYESFAGIYNDFNAANDYEMWLGVLLAELEKHGLRHGSALDVGCGTGRAFGPLLRRGWQVHGSDVSAAMLELAAEEATGRVGLDLADMRRLPRFGRFELVLVLNDAVNYLIGDGELDSAFAGLGENLAPHGLLVFDCNSLVTFEDEYGSGESVRDRDGRGWVWRGLTAAAGSGGVHEARIEGDDIEPFVNRERHFPIAAVEAALRAAGLEPLAVRGQQEVGGRVVLVDPPDEARDHKIVYVARRQGGPASVEAGP